MTDSRFCEVDRPKKTRIPPDRNAYRRYDEKCSEQQNHQTFKDLADLVKATGATSFVDCFSAVKPTPAQRSSFFWFHPAGYRWVLPKVHSWGADSQAFVTVQKRFSSRAAWSEVTAELVAHVHRNWEDFHVFPISVSTVRGSYGKSFSPLFL